MSDEFLTVREVAEMLRLDQQTVRDWIDRGELPVTRAGNRRVRIARSDLVRFLDASRHGPRPAGDLEPLRQPLAAATAAVNENDRQALAAALLALAATAAELAKQMRP
jgi:excisionase family DNA binding protein